jgi:signal peptidase I
MKNRLLREIRDWIISILIAAVLAIAIKFFFFDIIEITGRSMLPTLYEKDKVAIEKLSLYIGNIKRGQVVILDPGDKGSGIYIKRVVGLPGEILEITGGRVYIDGELLDEDYLDEDTYTDMDIKITIPEDSVFVMGDNREVSEDSRVIGPIPIKNLKGHALFRVYPFDHLGKI